MSVGNYEDLGANMMEITQRLISNSNLCKLLYYTDTNPLSHTEIPDSKTMFNSYIGITGTSRTSATPDSRSSLVPLITSAEKDPKNNEFSDVILQIFVYVPRDTWLINDINFRPFLIMSEIYKTLVGKRCVGLGTIQGGDFSLDLLNDEMSCYIMTFTFAINV